jgi:hypothetical protein
MGSRSGDGDLERGGPRDQTVGLGPSPPETPVHVETVYDAIREVLTGRGWVQGRQTHGPRLSLTAAIDVVVGVDVDTRAAAGSLLARSGRVRRHLCELAGTANLVAWNDDRARDMGDVIDLLRYAAIAYPDD